MTDLDQITKEKLSQIERQMLAEEAGIAVGVPTQEQVEQINREMHRMARDRLQGMPKRFPDTIGTTDTIPDDVMKLAEDIRDRVFISQVAAGRRTDSDPAEIIASAIMAERERCALEAERIRDELGAQQAVGNLSIGAELASAAIRKGEA